MRVYPEVQHENVVKVEPFRRLISAAPHETGCGKSMYIKLGFHRYFGGINPFKNGKCVALRLTVSDLLKLEVYKNRLDDLKNLLPHDFNLTQPERADDIPVSVANFILEMLNYVRGNIRYCTPILRNGEIFLISDYHVPQLVVEAALLAEIALGSVDVSAVDLVARLKNFWVKCRTLHPDFQAHALIEYAKTKKISYNYLGNRKWLYGIGNMSGQFFETSLARDLKIHNFSKYSCKKIFDKVQARTAKFKIVHPKTSPAEIIKEIGFPCVVKPNSGGGGIGVTANIKSEKQLAYALEHAGLKSRDNKLVVEQHVDGEDHRILFVDGEFKGCVKSQSPYVVGNGFSTIQELIAEKNKDRTESFYKSNFKRKIKVDEVVLNKLSSLSLTLSSVPGRGQLISLRNNSNLGGGGDSIKVNFVHHTILDKCLEIMKKLKVYSAGIDYITTDITKSPDMTGGIFTEINHTPGVPVFINAGYSVVETGGFFLKDKFSNIPLIIEVMAEDFTLKRDLSENHSAFYFPRLEIHSCEIKKSPEVLPDIALSMYFSNEKIDVARVIFYQMDLLKFGIPENYTKILVSHRVKKEVIDFLQSCRVEYSFF